MKSQFKIIPVSEIPEAHDAPLENPMVLYKHFLQMDDVCQAEDGLGISAVQVGIPWCMFSVNWDGKYRHFVNCSYEPLVDPRQRSLQTFEGCLSLRGLNGELRQFLVDRYPSIVVGGFELISEYDLELKRISLELTNDIYTIVFQHEIDHSKGILISDLGREMEIL